MNKGLVLSLVEKNKGPGYKTSKYGIIGGEWFLRRGKIALTLTSAARECRDVLAIHLADRLRSKYLVTFSLLHLPKFAEYNDHFLTNLLASASDFFPMISTT